MPVTQKSNEISSPVTVSLPSSPIESSSKMLNGILTTDDNLTQSLSSHINTLARQNIQFNWKNIWDYFYHTVESKIIKDIVNTNSHCFTTESNCTNSSFLSEDLMKPLKSNSLEFVGDSLENEQQIFSQKAAVNVKSKDELANSSNNLNSGIVQSNKENSQLYATTPNSQYLQSMIVNTFNTPKYNITSKYLCTKLDTDIGSASCKSKYIKIGSLKI